MTPLRSGNQVDRGRWLAVGASLRRRARGRRVAKLRRIVAEVLFVTGLMLAPALAACDLTVWASCSDLDRGACVAPLARAFASMAGVESGTGSDIAPATNADQLTAHR